MPIPQITRKVVNPSAIRAEVERHATLDAMMSVVLLQADPFQHATDRLNALPCWMASEAQPQSKWLDLANDICIPETDETDEVDELGSYPDPAGNPYAGVRV
jgi:hypothetical protein